MKFLMQRISSFISDLIYKIKSKHRYKKRLKDIKKRDPYIYK
jgi:hypothetical protein